MQKCNIDSLPEELRTAKRFFPVTITAAGEKIPKMKQWNNPDRQKHAEECSSSLVGFDICGHGLGADYMVFDFDHVLDPEGNFTTAEAEAAYNKILSLMGSTWAEVSISGTGVHIVGSPTPGKFEAMKNDSTGVLCFPDGGKVETFYRTSGRYFLFTGTPFRNAPQSISSGAAVDAAIEWTRKRIAAQLAEKGQANKETPAPQQTAPQTEPGGIPDEYRVKAMLAALPCSECTYEDWLHVGMVIHDVGLSIDEWDSWSSLDSGRYKGTEDLYKHWKSFKPKNNGVSIGTLYNMAVRFGYNAKEIAREWYREHRPEEPFQQIPVEAEYFNFDVLKKPETQEVFICDKTLDARSIMECGAEAVAINGKAAQFVETVAAMKPENLTLILSLDPEDAKTISDGLRKAGVSFIFADVLAARDDKEAFAAAVNEAKTKASSRPDNVADYIELFMGEDIERFKQERKTGFPILDEKTGGFHPGLYVIAAISSLGKTDWALQLSDQLAASGEDVLFFSLEMSKLELVSRSLARTVAQEFPDKRIANSRIREGKLPAEARSAVVKYQKTVGGHLSIIEANFELTVQSISSYIKKYMKKTGTRPVVFLDYLQILQPTEEDARKGRREAIDNAVVELKRLSRELDIPIVVVSSVNRMNYQTPISFESLKESGGIEYSADVIFGMQLQCLGDKLFADEKKTVDKRKKIDEAKKAYPRKIEMKCLKNRFGITTFSILFDYFPDIDLFIETGGND